MQRVTFGLIILIVMLAICLPQIPATAQEGGMSVAEILHWVLSLLPGGWNQDSPVVYYHRDFREPVAGEDLLIGQRVTFDVQAQMAIGQTGMTGGTITGYSYESPPNVKPVSYTGPFNRAEWPTIRYIVRFDKQPGNPMYGNEIMLRRDQFAVQ